MSDLDSVIKKTLAQASRHSKTVFSQSPLTGEELLDLANGSGLRIAATTKPTGGPHLSITDVIVLDEKLYIGVDLATARYKNLLQNKGIVIMMTEGWKRQAIVEGEVQFLDIQSPLAARVVETQKKRYGWASEVIAEVVPRKIFTWKASPKKS